MPSKKIAEILINNINKLLEEKELTKRDLANKLGVKPSGVNKFLNPETNPKLDSLIAIATALETSLSTLITDGSNPLVDRIHSLNKELYSIEVSKSEKRIEQDEWRLRAEELRTEIGRKKLQRDNDSPWTQTQISSLICDYQSEIANLEEEIEDLTFRQMAIPHEIKRLEALIKSRPPYETNTLSTESKIPKDPQMEEMISLFSSLNQAQKIAAISFVQSLTWTSTSAQNKQKKRK